MAEEIQVKLNKLNIVLLAIGAALFVALSVFVCFLGHVGIGVIGFLFFGLCLVHALRKLLDRKPGLVINDSGIIDNSSAVGAGFVGWENIVEIKTSKVNGQGFITVIVNNADEIISRQKGVVKSFMSANRDQFESPVQINQSTLRINSKELIKLLLERKRMFDEKQNN